MISGNIRYLEKLYLLVTLSISIIISGCTVVSLENKTNQNPETLLSCLDYSSEHDIFCDGPPYVFRLAVIRKQTRPVESINPIININGIDHEMNIEVDWQNNISLWTYQIDENCVDVGSVPNYGFEYYFKVYYNWPGLFFERPPKILPLSGKYHSRVFGAGTFHYTPYPGFYYFGIEKQIIYSEECWNTNYECTTPTFKYLNWVHIWPGLLTGYEHTLTLRNLSPERVKLITLVLDNQNYDNFELIGLDNLPQIIDCEETYSFIIRYKPGYYQDPNFITGYYQAFASIYSTIQYIDSNDVIYGGPSINIDYSVQFSGT